jgi:hypothetical protein
VLLISAYFSNSDYLLFTIYFLYNSNVIHTHKIAIAYRSNCIKIKGNC